MTKSPFQMFLIAGLGIIALVAVLMFAGVLPGGLGNSKNIVAEEVVMWGPFNSTVLTGYFNALNEENKTVVTIKYIAKPPETYINSLIEAFARGEGPDLFFVDQKSINRLAGKVVGIPYSSYPQRDVLNDFADGASVFTNSKGLRVMPLMIDPLVMYYNRTMYTSANIVIPPKNWTEFLATIKPIVEIDTRNNITRTASALGEFNNITNAKYILSALLFQAGNPIVTTDINDNYNFVLGESFGFTPSPAEASLAFYQQFSNPAQVSYSWNRSISNDKDMFTAEKLATYFGFASELKDLQQKNPHLNLDAVVIPQKDVQKKVTYANFLGTMIAKSSQKPISAVKASLLLSQAKNLEGLAKILNYQPARRDLLVKKDSDPLVQVFKDSAVIARSWIDPDSEQTKQILRQMSENVQTGQIKTINAVKNASDKINRLFELVNNIQ